MQCGFGADTSTVTPDCHANDRCVEGTSEVGLKIKNMNSINLDNQFVVMTKSDFMDMVRETANVYAAAQMQAARPSTSALGAEYLTREETAVMLNVSLPTLWRWNRTGLLSNYKDGEAKVVYLKDEVLNFIKGRKNQKCLPCPNKMEGGES